MRGIAEHNFAELMRRHGGIYWPFVAERNHGGQFAGMVYVRVCKANSVYVAGSYGKIAVFVNILALLHTAIHENVLTVSFYQRA
jgi:hypothetical protein